MTIIGMWLATIGYGVLYAGAVKIGGGQCGLIDAFRGRCQVPTSLTAPAHTQSVTAGGTLGGRLLANQQAQASMIGTQPISQAV